MLWIESKYIQLYLGQVKLCSGPCLAGALSFFLNVFIHAGFVLALKISTTRLCINYTVCLHTEGKKKKRSRELCNVTSEGFSIDCFSLTIPQVYS